jgi:hypothetical protein
MNNDAQITSVAIQEKTMRFASGLTAVRPYSPLREMILRLPSSRFQVS